jgi:hypothetical protein
MATLRLGRYEVEEYELPRMCMCCGARARYHKTKNFQWSPPWAFLVLGAIGAMIFMKRITVDVPLCEKHKWHWGIRTALAIGGLVVIVLLVMVAAAVASEDNTLAPFVFLPLLVLFLGWIGLLIGMAVTTIRPTEITDKSVTLVGVCQEFIEAVEEARRGDEDDDRPRRSRRRFDHDEDDRPRPRRRAAEEDDGGYYDPEAKRRRGREVDADD